jgi:NodT family efflux transporter outer membrane factor (OMF) lipoprotein
MIRRLFSLGSNTGLLFMLGGCLSTQSGNERAEFMEPPSLERTLSQAAAQERRGVVGVWPDEQWWRQFRSQDLDRIMDTALIGSPSLRKAADRLGEADALARAEGARLLPFIDANLGMRQSRIPSHGVVASYNPDLAGLEKTMGFVNPFSFRYEFDFWGKNRAGLEAALGEAAAKEAEVAEARLLLTTSVTRSFIRGTALAQQVYLAQLMVKARRELLRLAESRFRSGLDTQDAVKQAAIEFEVANKREAATRALLVLQQDLLARLMGDGPDSTSNLFEGKKVAIPGKTPLPARLPVELLAHRPDLAAAMHRAESAAQQIHVAKARFLPSIDLTALTGLEASVTSTNVSKLASFLFRASAFNYQAMPGMRLPLFEGGRLRGQLEAARSEYDEAVELYNETLLHAVQQVADGLSNWKQTRAILASQNRLLASKRGEFGLVRVRMRTGLNDRREFLMYAHGVLEQQFALKALEADHLSAAVDLIQALGGGYSNGVESSRPQLAPEESLSGLETLAPAWILDDLASTLLPMPRKGKEE